MSHIYLTLDDVLSLHDDQIRRYGGSPGIRDMGLIEMGLYRPQTGYYTDIIQEAAALWESFMMNHPFVDGNKRAALAVMHTFLLVNGIAITAKAHQLEDFIYGLFDTGSVNFKNLDAWLRENTRAL